MNFTKGKVFFDTNIFIYLLTVDEPDKQMKCRKILENLIRNRNPLVWSTQVAQELSANLIKKQNMDPIKVKSLINGFHRFELVLNDLTVLNGAFEINAYQKFSFWDSLIISSAISSKCSYVLSEDMHHEQKIEGVKIVNPFLI